ncbi:hypothetical protein NDU88_008756 [Pleurodeles waltl]|uniref:Uncharacterized protein n=1 Tax=Pleurodeles waltl TaxID=8319 RepID=A0AAV7QPH8_PLEWA|nr:hypothetical protein NDU88_008756 [Pleurodeles waltl]
MQHHPAQSQPTLGPEDDPPATPPTVQQSAQPALHLNVTGPAPCREGTGSTFRSPTADAGLDSARQPQAARQAQAAGASRALTVKKPVVRHDRRSGLKGEITELHCCLQAPPPAISRPGPATKRRRPQQGAPPGATSRDPP